MLTLPIFRQLAYISPSQFLRWLECEYRTYLTRQSGLPYLEQPSNLYAEIGTCFDAFVKEYIVKKRGMNIPALKLEYQLARIKNPSAIPIGRAAAIAYTQSPLIKEFLTGREIFLDQELIANIGGVRILGRLDALVDFKVREWKTRGFSSRQSPTPGYAERYDFNEHTQSIIQKPPHIDIVKLHEVNFEWAVQQLFYCWIISDVDYEYNIHELVRSNEGYIITRHTGCIEESFRKRIKTQLELMWERLTGRFYYSEIDLPNPSSTICEKYGSLCEAAVHCPYYQAWRKENV